MEKDCKKLGRSYISLTPRFNSDMVRKKQNCFGAIFGFHRLGIVKNRDKTLSGNNSTEVSNLFSCAKDCSFILS